MKKPIPRGRKGGRKPTANPRKPTTIRLDPDVAAWVASDRERARQVLTTAARPLTPPSPRESTDPSG